MNIDDFKTHHKLLFKNLMDIWTLNRANQMVGTKHKI